MNEIRVFVWDDDSFHWIGTIGKALHALRPSWGIAYVNCEEATMPQKLKEDAQDFLRHGFRPTGDTMVFFDVYCSRRAENLDFSQYELAIIDDWYQYQADGELDDATRRHYGTKVLAARIQASNPHAITMVATAHAEHVNPADMIEGAQGRIRMFLDKQDLLVTESPTVPQLIAGFIAAAVYRQQADKRAVRAEKKAARLIGDSSAVAELKKLIAKIGKSRNAVLIRGETGSGKDLAAQELHRHSARADKPFVAFNCAALSPTLIESELFGHEKGSFTGATQLRRGRFELANGGTIFINEIGDMPMDAQVKLLMVLDENKFLRVGGENQIPVDIRLISATHKPLEELVENGSFRSDLYYRLKVSQIVIPPLRERKEDIEALAKHFAQDEAELADKPVIGFAAAALKAMKSYDWPGNVRQLKHAVESAVVKCESQTIEIGDLPPEIVQLCMPQPASTKGAAWHSELDPARLLNLARAIWKTKGVNFGNDPNRILAEHGALYLRASLALLKRALAEKLGYRKWKTDFDQIFGFKTDKRKTVELYQYLQNLTTQDKYRKYFPPRAGRKQYGAMDVDADAVDLEKAGIHLDLE